MTDVQAQKWGPSERDLDFVVEQAAPEFKDKAKLKQLIKEDASFRRGLLGDERVFRRVMAEEDIFIRISPALYFEILLRRAQKELEKSSHTVERAGTQAVPVFDAQEASALLARQEVLLYLAGMLSSFSRIESFTISVRVRKGIWRKISFNDMDIDSLTRLCETVDEEHRLNLYKRIADVCLFVLGIFPEYTQFDYRYPFSEELRPKIAWRERRGMEDYEEEGRRFYKLAEKHPSARILDLSETFRLLHLNFNTAKKPLNFISEHYLSYKKHRLFPMEAQ